MKTSTIRTALAVGLAALCAGSASGAGTATTYVVLLDASSSVGAEDRGVYAESLGNVKKAVRPGDRLVLSTIGNRDRSAWVRELDAEVPAATGRTFQDRKRRETFDREVDAAFDAVMKRPAEKSTRILDALEAASEAYSKRPNGPKVLVVLSDMEETGRFDLASGNVRDVRAPAALAGASVYVAGAGGGKNYARVESFWRRYFGSVPGAAVSQYGRYPADPVRRAAP